MKPLVLTVRFACELAALAGVAWWGWTVHPVLAVVLVVVVALAWGAFVAPRRRVRRGEPLRYAVELCVFAGAAAAFWAVGEHAVAAAFAAAAVVSGALDRAL